MAGRLLVGKWLPVLILAPLLAFSRPLPDKNELANACYFTYKVGYIICDSGLGAEEAQEAMKAGKCNEDFRLMGSDFQRKVVRHYTFGERPPLEEAMWLLTAPENFQLRTLKECSAMQIVAYILVAEAKLYVQGTTAAAPPADMVRLALQQAQQVPTEVYSALARAWPLEAALQRYQATAFRLQTLMQDRAEMAFGVQFVVCRCEEDLSWLTDLSFPTSGASLLVFETCAGRTSSEVAPAAAGNGGSLGRLAVASALAPPDVRRAGSGGECGARGVLSRAVAEAAAVAADPHEAPYYVGFLPATKPGEAERQLLELVVQSLSLRSLSVPFLPLASLRSAPRVPSPCGRAILREALSEGSGAGGGGSFTGWPAGYEGARFLVSGERLRSRPAAYYERLLALLDEPPPACRGSSGAGGDGAAEAMDSSLATAWHAVFGEPAWQPPRSEDEQLPLFLRASDGPSGFKGSRMPQMSVYLNSIAATTGIAAEDA